MIRQHLSQDQIADGGAIRAGIAGDYRLVPLSWSRILEMTNRFNEAANEITVKSDAQLRLHEETVRTRGTYSILPPY